jgi:hypothetical protein
MGAWRIASMTAFATVGSGGSVRTPQEATFMAKRTTMRSSKGTKLYAVRDKKGRFKDIQTYKRAHGQDIKRKSKAERAAKEK